MLTLFIVRHAQAENILSQDKDRALTLEGRAQVLRLAHQCQMAGDVIQCIIHSAALRTAQTANILAEQLNISSRISVEKIYNGSIYSYLDEINALPSSIDKAMIVGHNPAITELVHYLTGETVHPMPTASCAVVVCPYDTWTDLGHQKCMWRQLLLS